MREKKTKWPSRKRWIEELNSEIPKQQWIQTNSVDAMPPEKVTDTKNGNDAWITQEYVIDEITLSFRYYAQI